MSEKKYSPVFNSYGFNYPITNPFVQEKQIIKESDISEIAKIPPRGRILALDPGTKKIGVAISDETRLLARPLPRITRRSWKKLLAEVKAVIAEFDAAALVIGLPYNFDGGESEMSAEARAMAAKFALSLDIPVFLRDERVSSYEARGRLWKQGVGEKESRLLVDSEAAAIILEDFLAEIKRPEKNN